MNTPATFRDLTPAAARLARLVPQVYLARDVALGGGQLLNFLEVLAAPLEELERAIGTLLDDHFVERASAEALPLIAELVGARLLGDDAATNRAVVARTIHWRRRKGTLGTLEEVLTQATGWATEVDEAFRSLLQLQDLAFPLPWRGRNTVLWDPIALSDPLSRRAPPNERPRSGAIPRGPLVDLEEGETVEHALRRLGRADAGRYAAAPRTIDFTGWARPEHVVIRSSRLRIARVGGLEAGRVADDGTPETGGNVRIISHITDPAAAMVGFALEPLGRPLPLAWNQPVASPDELGGLTSAHEPAPPAPLPVRPALLTPTALAADGDLVAAGGSIVVTVEDIPVIGAAADVGNPGPVDFAPLGTQPWLRFADIDRPAPDDAWTLQLIAVDDDATLDPAILNTAVGDENPLVATTVLRRGAQDPLVQAAAAQVPRSGAVVALRVTRQRLGRGYRRDAAGAWSGIEPGVRRGEPLTPAVVLDDGGTTVIARLERQPAGDIVVASWQPDSPAPWTADALDIDTLAVADRPDLDAVKEGPALGLAVNGDGLLLVAPIADHETLGVWRIDGVLAGAPEIARIDQPGPRRPPARMAPAACLHNDRLFVHGGEDSQQTILGDLWSITFAGADAGRWQPHRVRAPRDRQTDIARSGARLLSTLAGLVLIGGAGQPGSITLSVWRTDVSPARPRPSWTELPALPLVADAPGAIWARAEGSDLHVLAWSNRVWPRSLHWPDGAASWQRGAEERTGSPNPPAEGDALFLGDEFLVLGPPPLPPSEVLFAVGGKGRIAFLPAFDIADAAAVLLFFVDQDGTTRRWFPPGEPARGTLRLGFSREAPVAVRQAPARQIGVPSRLTWEPFRLRQRNLEPWDRPLALDLSRTVALDPRLGRVALPAAIARGRLGGSFMFGRAAGLGPGFLPDDRAVPASWHEPADPDVPSRFDIPPPPDRIAGGDAVVTAWVSPESAGIENDGPPVVATIAEGLQSGISFHNIGILGSVRLDSAILTIGQAEVLSLFPDASPSTPFIGEIDGISLLLQERLDANADPDIGPSWFLAGLTFAGAVSAAVSAGVLDLRWCLLSEPGLPGLTVSGVGHQSALARLTLPAVRLTVRLYGCLIGRLDVPPWVQVIAAGCTFDGGSPEQPAINASGARLRLRHCTVHGTTGAGLLEASSCAFKGEIRCERPDLSWARHSIVSEGGRLPLLYECLTHPISFESLIPTQPAYLLPAENNKPPPLSLGERRRMPGAHDERTPRLTELAERTEDFLPLGLSPHHFDRASLELSRMQRRLP